MTTKHPCTSSESQLGSGTHRGCVRAAASAASSSSSSSSSPPLLSAPEENRGGESSSESQSRRHSAETHRLHNRHKRGKQHRHEDEDEGGNEERGEGEGGGSSSSSKNHELGPLVRAVSRKKKPHRSKVTSEIDQEESDQREEEDKEEGEREEIEGISNRAKKKEEAGGKRPRKKPKPASGPKSIADYGFPNRGAQLELQGQSTSTQPGEALKFLPLFVKFHKVGSGTVSELMRRHCNALAKRVHALHALNGDALSLEHASHERGSLTEEEMEGGAKEGLAALRNALRRMTTAASGELGDHDDDDRSSVSVGGGSSSSRRHSGGGSVGSSSVAAAGGGEWSVEEATQLFPPFPWRGGPFCGLGPHEHSSLTLYHERGLPAFEYCSLGTAPVRLYTVLRDPVEKFFSGLYFWKRAIPEGFAEKLLHPGELTVQDIDELAHKVYRRGLPTVGRAGALLQYAYVLGRLREDKRDEPSDRDIENACERLRTDFTVGTTENMDSFLVLIALENRWPLEEMCYFRSHVNKARPRGNSFTPEVLSRVRQLLARDEEVLQCARKTHESQASKHANFSSAFQLFTSEPFQNRCVSIKSRNVKADQALPKQQARAKNFKECAYTYSFEEEALKRRAAGKMQEQLQGEEEAGVAKRRKGEGSQAESGR